MPDIFFYKSVLFNLKDTSVISYTYSIAPPFRILFSALQ